MTRLDAQTTGEFEFGATVRSADGFEASFLMDDSLASWWSIVRWNLHHHHWADLRRNARDLFTTVIWRKLWRHS